MPTPPARAVDEQALADAQAGLREERVVGGGEDLGHAAGRVPVELLGHRHRRALVDDRELGLAAAGHDRHHAVAGLEALRRRRRPRRPRPPARARGCPAARRAARGSGPSSCSMSAPLRPGAVHADQQLAESPGTGSGCSSTAIEPSRIVAARMRRDATSGAGRAVRSSRPLSMSSGVRADSLKGKNSTVNMSLMPAIPRIPPLWRESRIGLEAAALRRSPVCGGARRPARRAPPGAADPGLHGRRRARSATMPSWLRRDGYCTHRAGIRANVDCSEEACQRLEERLEHWPSATASA